MSAPVRIMPSGPHAALAEYESLDDVMRVSGRLLASPPANVIDVVPAARTILVTARTPIGAEIVAALADTSAPASTLQVRPAVVIEVDYDGDDLAAVADACSLGVDEVIALHSSAEYTVAFCGFMPGFSYLVGLHPGLQLPRRATPRTRVAAGTVAIASEFTAIYPTASPGGWHLLGRTDAVMWDDDRATPALLPPGTRVRFAPR